MYNLELRWWLPEGFSVDCPQTVLLPHHSGAAYPAEKELRATITAGDKVGPVNRVVLEVSVADRPFSIYVPMLLLG